MKNTLSDLNNYLFEALEEVQCAETKEELETASKKAEKISSIATAITGNAKIMLDAKKIELQYDRGGHGIGMPTLLENN